MQFVSVSDLDACVEPVLDFTEARDHQHNKERGVFVEVRPGVYEPGKSRARDPCIQREVQVTSMLSKVSQTMHTAGNAPEWMECCVVLERPRNAVNVQCILYATCLSERLAACSLMLNCLRIVTLPQLTTVAFS